MDAELRLWSLPINEVRQFFFASPDEAARLRDIAARVIPPPEHSHGLLSKLGPLTRKNPPMPVIVPGVPNRQDVENLLSGRYVNNSRQTASWEIVRAWLDASCFGTCTAPLPTSQIDDIEFDLVRSNVPTHLGIRRTWARPLEIPLQATDCMSVGFMKHADAVQLAERWTEVREDLEEASLAFVDAILPFVSLIGSTHSEKAAAEGREEPDLIAWWTAR